VQCIANHTLQNRGIGLEVCKLLLSKSTSTGQPIHLFAASRSGKPLNLDPGSHHTISYPKLDISDSSSITSLANSIEAADVLINNAGVNLDQPYNLANASQTLLINYLGTLEMCETFLPVLKANSTPEARSRIVNLSSIASSLKAYSPEIQARFRSASSSLTLSELDGLAEEYLAAVSKGRESRDGFGGPGRSYSFSKACVNAFTFILARENPDVLINACCPGWVSTDMGRLIGRPPKKPEDGAKIPVRLAIGDVGDVSGAYWANSSIRGKGDGEVQEW
jgi:carbonyl reductase 1